MSEIWHKVTPPPVFHDVAQGPHKVSDDIFPIKGVTASCHIHEHVYFVPLRAFYLGRGTRPIFAGRIILLGDDHDLGRGS